MNTPVRFLAVLFISAAPVLAGPLHQAAINQIVKDVKVVDLAKGARPAALRETIKDDLAVKTGVESRAELLFQDNTLTRLGAETFFSFKAGTRDLSLDRGTMLLQVPKGLGGARIRTASVTASITGTTIMMEHLPSKHLKVLVLEGSLRLSPNDRFGEAMLLTAGKMVIMKPDAKRIPEPVDVDLRKTVRTSVLIDPAAFKGKSKADPAPLPSMGLIQKEIAKQDALIKDRSLMTTNLLIAGSGTEVTVASDAKLAALDRGILTTIEPVVPTNTKITTTPVPLTRVDLVSTLDNITRLPDSKLIASNGNDSNLPTTVGTNVPAASDITGGVIDTGNTTTGAIPNTGGNTTTTPPATTPPAATVDTSLPTVPPTNPLRINATAATAGQVIDRSGADAILLAAPGAGGGVELTGNYVTLSPSAIAGVRLDGGDAVLNLTQEGGDGGRLVAGTIAAPITGNIDIDAPISATTGANSLLTPTGGRGGGVQLVANGNVTVNNTVTVSNSAPGRASKSGGNIGILAKSGSITVTNSGQLLSLLAAAAPGAGGTVKFVAEQGDIRVTGGKVAADRGTVEMLTTGANAGIQLRNAGISGDVVKIGALGANGQLLVGGGTINADTSLKLYAGSSNGEVRFTDNVTLGGASTKIIAGKTVTIDSSKTVTIGGSKAASVFTDNANYTGSGGNGSTTGKFGGAGASTRGFANRPAF